MAKILDNTIVVFVVCILMLIIIPLSPFVMDMMIIFNMMLSIGIFLLAMYIKESLEFSIFPSLLLITTLLRVGLNVASTRLILGNGGEAGNVIRTFGEFVIGGNPLVGFIIFLIIVVVQFVVITKGSERVAEVSARFTLDAMPGKQMAIDADLSSGLISDTMAKQRRNKIQREADFYGAMDGASKFVKGDAIVSIIIVLINLIGGSVIGLLVDGKPLAEVLSIYTVATVGDGLVSQIPALLISTATGIIVTRAASENSLSTDLTKQLVSQPVTLIITGGILLLMCFIPGLPFALLLTLGIGLILAGRKLKTRKEKLQKQADEPPTPISETEYYRDPEHVYEFLGLEPIEVEFGYSLIPLVDEKKGGAFVDRMVMLRKQFALELGLVIPAIRLRDDSALEPNEYVIRLRGEKIAKGKVLADHFLAIGQIGDEVEIEGIDTIEPAFGIKGKWVDADNRERAQIFGYTVIDPLSVIVTHLSEIIKKYAHELLGRKEVNNILETAKKSDKFVVEEVVPGIISIGVLQKILANLLMEGIPIRDIITILETIGEYGTTFKDPEILTEYVRQALKRTITRKFINDNITLKVITINTNLESMIMNNVKKNEHGSFITMEPETVQKIVKSHLKEVAKITEIVKEPIILTSPLVRLYYKKLIEPFVKDSVVLSFNEIDSGVKIQSIGMITI